MSPPENECFRQAIAKPVMSVRDVVQVTKKVTPMRFVSSLRGGRGKYHHTDG
jgi:hypothetical protein